MWCAKLCFAECACLVKIAIAGSSYELLHFIRGWAADEGQQDELQLGARVQSGGVLEKLAVKKQPLPEAWRKAVPQIQMLLQCPHVGEQIRLQRDCQLLSGSFPNTQHCRCMEKTCDKYAQTVLSAEAPFFLVATIDASSGT